MKKLKILIVGGTFDRDGGKRSGLIKKTAINITNNVLLREDVESVRVINGGTVETLHTTVIEQVKNYDIVLWMPNVSNDELKIRNVKELNPKRILISLAVEPPV